MFSSDLSTVERQIKNGKRFTAFAIMTILAITAALLYFPGRYIAQFGFSFPPSEAHGFMTHEAYADEVYIEEEEEIEGVAYESRLATARNIVADVKSGNTLTYVQRRLLTLFVESASIHDAESVLKNLFDYSVVSHETNVRDETCDLIRAYVSTHPNTNPAFFGQLLRGSKRGERRAALCQCLKEGVPLSAAARAFLFPVETHSTASP